MNGDTRSAKGIGFVGIERSKDDGGPEAKIGEELANGLPNGKGCSGVIRGAGIPLGGNALQPKVVGAAVKAGR